MSNWANQNNLHLIYNPQDKGNFFSSRRLKTCTPDLVFLMGQENRSAMQARLEVLNNFSNTQYRPILITTGLNIPVIISLPKLRWNFRKANWEQYKSYIKANCNQIRITQEIIERFIGIMLKSSKVNIPRGHRGQYIPC